ncbi:dephospho-CoA kinase [Rothia sp. ZJ932]|nr:dephospho-CoA kinase [Rothia sp. ZJ932]
MRVHGSKEKSVRLGLTGGIGSGKSTVAKILEEQGATVIDADAISRQLMQPGHRVLTQTAETFGNSILHPDGSLNRAALAEIIFKDATAREKLNAIVHPAVREESARIADYAQQTPDFSGIIVEDIPLLTETGQADRFDAVIVVEADPEVRVQRLVGIRGMSEADARVRMNAQASDSQRRAIATWVLDNSGNVEQTRGQVEQIWLKIQELKTAGS